MCARCGVYTSPFDPPPPPSPPTGRVETRLLCCARAAGTSSCARSGEYFYGVRTERSPYMQSS